MKFNVLTIPPFDNQFKRLCRKYPSLKKEINELSASLSFNPIQGTPIGNQCYKLRLAISSKGKGKSGGGRIITHIYFSKETIYLLSIYDKSEMGAISVKELSALLSYIV